LRQSIVPFSRVKQYKKKFFECLTLENGTDRLSQNVGTELPFYAA
jgi:hypothetical protein